METQLMFPLRMCANLQNTDGAEPLKATGLGGGFLTMKGNVVLCFTTESQGYLWSTVGA